MQVRVVGFEHASYSSLNSFYLHYLDILKRNDENFTLYITIKSKVEVDFDVPLHISYVQHGVVNNGLFRIFRHATASPDSPPIRSLQCVIDI
jgi:hypothetical protein